MRGTVALVDGGVVHVNFEEADPETLTKALESVKEGDEVFVLTRADVVRLVLAMSVGDSAIELADKSLKRIVEAQASVMLGDVLGVDSLDADGFVESAIVLARALNLKMDGPLGIRAVEHIFRRNLKNVEAARAVVERAKAQAKADGGKDES